MPLFSEHIANMYYGSSSPYTGSPYSYSSSVSPLGSSYSASYLNPGSSYSNHSSLSSYSRAPLSSRWITSAGRNYSPMLTTITERGSASPVRIHSPRRIPISNRSYGTPTYTSRPVNINTADIDVSRDRYRHKAEPPKPATPPKPVPPKPIETPNTDSENGPFMPRVDGKPETGIDSSPGVERTTIKRGRTVVRLYTIKRNSPRKPNEDESQASDTTEKQEVEQKVNEDTKTDEKEFTKWRQKLSDDLAYKDKKEKKTLGAKLVEKFKVKDTNETDLGTPNKVQKTETDNSQSLPTTPIPNINTNNNIINATENKCLDRRCSMELLAEQANLLDSLIRSENLSTATLDLSKVGIAAEPKNIIDTLQSVKRRKPDDLQNPLKTTKSDHSLHDSLNSYKDVRDPRNFSKRRSIKKSSSGSSIRRLDSITEFPKELSNVDLPAIEESRLSVKQDNIKQKPKPKLKTKITSTVEVSAPISPLKFRIENVTVEEKLRIPKKEITYSSEVVEISPQTSQLLEKVADKSKETNNVKKITKKKSGGNELASPEPADGNFWDKIGKRETVYLVKRKQNLDEAKEKHKRALFWFPEEEDEGDNCEEIKPNNISESNIITSDNGTYFIETNKLKEINEDSQKVSVQSPNKSEDDIKDQSDKLASVPKKEITKQQNDAEQKLKDTEIRNEPEISNKCNCMDESVTNIIPELNPDVIKETAKGSLKSLKTYKVDSDTISFKVTTDSKECKNLGKSASLDDIDENKVKKSSQKKTKSEKSKKLMKMSEKTELKSLQSVLPKASAKIEDLQKRESPKISGDTNTKCKLEQNVAALESVPKIPIHKPVGEQTKKEIEQPPCQLPKNQSAEQKTIESNTVKINTSLMVSSKDLPEVGQEQNKLIESKVEESNAKLLKTNTNILLQSSEPSTLSNTSSTTSEQIVTAKLSETKALDLNKNVKVSQKSSPETKLIDSTTIGQNTSRLPEVDKSDNKQLLDSQGPSTSKGTFTPSNNVVQTVADSKVPNSNQNRALGKSSPEVKSKPRAPAKNSNDVTKNDKTDDKVLKSTITPLTREETSTDISSKLIDISSKPANILTSGSVTTVSQTADIDSNPIDPHLHGKTKTNDVLDIPVVLESKDIPNIETESRVQTELKTKEENKAENIQKDEQPETSTPGGINLPAAPKKPVKEEKAAKPLIATPRPLQKKAPQVIHSSDSSDSSSEEESSEEEDEDESEASEDSGDFYECENNPDGRTSTGSNDSGFDSSAPASPATFSQIKKDCDVNCHRKCEKLTANLCGVNQRLLVEALASRTASRKGGEASGTSTSAAPANSSNTDISEQELEQSTAYDIFRKTGRFTPPARSIPRFRKYTVEDFQFIKVLGKGSFGKVLLAELRDTEYYYAVKCLKKDVVLEDDDVECTLIERKVLALGTNHPYLCHLFATFQTDSHLFFVMEYLNGGDLMFHIQQSGRFPEARARFYAAEIVSGLKFLHKRGIVYRDLKLDNILLDFEGHVRIADFGMCKLQIYLEKTADTFCGTPDYMAPEIIKGLKYNQTVDWWSFGVLLYEMLIGQSPFSGCDEDELFWSICNEMPSYPRFLSHEALTILTRLLDKDSRSRLGGTECMHGDIREQDFFHPISWDRLERRELETPFRPRVRHPMDTQYFDKAFTGERPRLTAVEPHVLRSMDQEPFRGFSYTNPNTTDR